MFDGWFSTLRPRLMLLAFLVVLPFMGLTLFSFVERRQQAVRDAQAEALRLTGAIVHAQESLTVRTQGLLQQMIELMSDPEPCSAAFAELLGQHPEYVNLGAAEPDGDVYCSARPLSGPVNLVDMPFFQRAVESRDFSIGDYQFSPTTNKPMLTYAYPMLDDAGQIESVVFASLNLAWFNQPLAEIPLPPDSAFTVIDQSGTVLARFPEPQPSVGQPSPQAPLIQAALFRQGEGTAELDDLDGMRRLYAFTRMQSPPISGVVYVSVGIPVEVAFADANRLLARDLLAFAVVSLLAMLIAWVGGDVFIRRPAHALLGAAGRLAAGDLSARTGVDYRLGEPGQLARAFDEMAAALQERESERRRAEETLQSYAAELEQRVAERMAELEVALQREKLLNELKSRFSSMVSHEFRNPLAAILISADVLKRYNHKLSEDKRLEHVEKIQMRVRFLVELLDDILTISKADTVGLDFNPAPVNLEALCRSIVEEMQPDTAPQIALAASAGCAEIMGDEKLLHQMISNLLSNALKYSLNGGVVQIELRCDNGHAVISVKDQGIGIPEDDLERLFDLFHRAKNTAGIPGTGLGLAIARRAAEAHGGTITVESKLDVGSTFTVRLPLKS